MPYKYPDDIPDAIKDLPADAQKMWVSVFNSAYAQYDGDEGKSNATAWAVVNKEYEKVDGDWVKKAMEAEKKFMRFSFTDLIGGITFKDVGGKKTSEIQLFKTGKWQHPIYGEFEVTENDLSVMEDNYKAGDAEIVVDYQHGSLSEDPEAAKAAGWVKKLINKGKELYAKVEWTAKAVEYIKNKEYRFISPEFNLDFKNPEGGKKQGPTLLAVALTNRPFLKGMTPVFLSERALAATLEDDKINCQVIYSYKEKSKKLTKPKGGGKEMELKDVREAMNLSEEVDEAGVLAAIKELGEAGGKTAEDKKVLRSALKLTEDASDQDVLDNINEMSATAKEDKDKAAKLTDRVAKLENDQLEADRDRVIEAAIKEGKVTPVAREKWEKMYMKDPQGTTELIADLGVVIDATETGGNGGPAGNSGAEAKLDAAVKTKMKDSGSDYSTALKEVGSENPKLVEDASPEAKRID